MVSGSPTRSDNKGKGHNKSEGSRRRFRSDRSLRRPSVFTVIKKVKVVSWHSLHHWSSYSSSASWKCYWKWRDGRMGAGAARRRAARPVCIFNEVSVRFRAAWPFSDSLNVRYFPLGVQKKKKKKPVCCFSCAQWELYWTQEGEKKRASVSPRLSLSNVRQNCD